MEKAKILIVDDEPGVRAMLEALFERAGATAITAAGGQEALRMFYAERPDLVILDLMMPDVSGYEVAQYIRQLSSTPIIMVTALGQESDIVRGLDIGAVDYVTKPFKPSILEARARAALRQARQGRRHPATAECCIGDLRVDFGKREVFLAGEPVRLTRTEFKLLSFLAQHPGQVLTYEQLVEHVWGWQCEADARNLHVLVSRLRQKLADTPPESDYLQNEYGVGYRLAAPAMTAVNGATQP